MTSALSKTACQQALRQGRYISIFFLVLQISGSITQDQSTLLIFIQS